MSTKSTTDRNVNINKIKPMGGSQIVIDLAFAIIMGVSALNREMTLLA